ncbi:MAG: hypothetical protein EZS28_054900, partial [Streblomastix strix]
MIPKQSTKRVDIQVTRQALQDSGNRTAPDIQQNIKHQKVNIIKETKQQSETKARVESEGIWRGRTQFSFTDQKEACPRLCIEWQEWMDPSYHMDIGNELKLIGCL